MKLFKNLDNFIDKVATYVLVVCVLSMLFFSVSNIVLRWFNSHVMWIEPMVRYLVVISAFLGGVVATGRRAHIGIDIIGKYFENKKMHNAHLWVKRLTAIVSLVALCFLTYACIGFVKQEAMYGKIIFLKIHAKYLAMILPIGFGLMGIRFLLSFLMTFDDSIKEED